MDRRKLSYFVDPLTATRPLPLEVVQNFKRLRLEALSSNPSAFLSTFAREKNFSDDQWSELILDPSHHYFICHTSPYHEENMEHEDDPTGEGWPTKNDWVGMLLLLGPYSKDDYGATPLLDPTALGSDEEETRWHLTGLYLRPESRCEASGIAVHEAILSYLRAWTDDHLVTAFAEETGLEKPKRARIAGQLRTDDDQLLALYKTLAGQTVGWADGELGARIAGISHLPEDRHLRLRIMERVIEC
ncbi:MAG: hypothetical protein Q9166_000616 [cf. Caloplaca sp. 2 TL-2023]